MSEIILTKENFEAEVLQSKQPVLVDFWATWCGPCQMLAPTVAAIAEEYAGKVKVGKVNVDEQPELANAFRISAIPTLLVFREGKVAEQSVGYCQKEKLIQMIQ